MADQLNPGETILYQVDSTHRVDVAEDHEVDAFRRIEPRREWRPVAWFTEENEATMRAAALSTAYPAVRVVVLP